MHELRRFGWLVLALCLPASVPGADDTEIVRAFADRCVELFEQRQWRAAFGCVDPASLQEFRDRYSADRIEPTYKNLPAELTSSFGTDITREELMAMPTPDLLTGALDGAIANFSSTGYTLEQFNLRLLRVDHRIAEVYVLHIRASIAVVGRKRREFSRKYQVRLRLLEDGPKMDIPRAVFDLLSL